MPNVQVSYHWVTNKPRILWCTTMSIYFAHRSVHWLRSLVWLCSSWFLSGNRLRGWCVPQKAHFMGVAELSEGKLNCTNPFQAPTCIVSANILLARENLWPSLKKRDRVILSCVCVCVGKLHGFMAEGTMEIYKERWRTIGTSSSIYDNTWHLLWWCEMNEYELGGLVLGEQ